MPADSKITANPEATARNLIGEFFLTHIYRAEDREKISSAMDTWSSKKRSA
jgi:hypothetical protein